MFSSRYSSSGDLKVSSVRDLILDIWEPRDRCTPEQVIQRTQSRFIEIQSTFLELLQSQHLLFDSCWFLTMFKIVVSLWGVSMYKNVFVFKEGDGDLNVRSCVLVVDIILPVP